MSGGVRPDKVAFQTYDGNFNDPPLKLISIDHDRTTT